MVSIEDTIFIRSPEQDEGPAIKALIDIAANRGDVLPRSLEEIEGQLELFLVCHDADGLAGCCALHPDTETLAEVRSIVVRPDCRGRGLGSRLIDGALDLAQSIGMERVYALTRVPTLFEGCGFAPIEMGELPHKVFKDCLRCRLYPNCDEMAVMRDLHQGREASGKDDQEE